MDNNNNGTPHRPPQEFMCPDGYISTRVPLNAIRFLDPDAVQHKVDKVETARYAHYCELIRNGAYANGVPIVYRTPKGTLFASDLRYSDLVIHAERATKVHPSVPRNVVHPMMAVKVIEIASLADIPVQRAQWLEVHAGTKADHRVGAIMARIDARYRGKDVTHIATEENGDA